MGDVAPKLIELVSVSKTIAAPVSAVWAIVSDFAHPERIVPGLTPPALIGAGVGMVRLVRVGGLTMRERLLARDEAAGILRYEISPDGDMPLAGLSRLVATVTMRQVETEQTELRWQVRGAVDGDPAQVRVTLTSMYEAGLSRIAALVVGTTEVLTQS